MANCTFIKQIGIDNNAYTNILAKHSIDFAIEVRTLLGKQVGTEIQPTVKDPMFNLQPILQVPSGWQNISNNIYVPFNATGNFHPEYDGYQWGQVVKQVSSSPLLKH